MRGALVLAVLGLAACGRPQAGEVRAPLHPTIVSLNPCSDAILAQVAPPGRLLAISHYSHDPASSSMDMALARRFPETSGTVEEVVALSPDVVVAGTYMAPATRQSLASLGIRVVTMPIPSSIAESEAQVRELADLSGNYKGGQALIRSIESAVSSAKPRPGAAPISALVWESGGIVAGNGTLIADLLARSGFVNGTAARGLSQADFLPLERMVAEPPRVILAVGNAQSQDDRMLRHPALDAMPGTLRVSFDSALLWCGGPTIPRALARLAEVRKKVVPQ